MIKVFLPLYSLQPHGWFGGDMYRRVGLVYHPYPIGFMGRYFVPGAYYSPQGWYYQRRRTWHGTITSAVRMHTTRQPRSIYQVPRRNLFYQAVKAWQSMSQATKDIYHKWTYPRRASGYNRFISWFLKHMPLPIVSVATTIQKVLSYAVITSQTIQKTLQYSIVTAFIFQEDGAKILTESSENLIQE